jgi:serine/threonine-protein kinase RsbW
MAVERLPLTLTLPSDPRFLPVARTFAEAVCQANQLDPSTANAIVIALHEAICNVIQHAHRDQPQAPFQLRCYLTPDRVEIHLLDEGEPFDLAAVPHLDPAEMRIGGRGVFLMRALMDELSCQPRGERGNLLRMVKWCHGRSCLADCG